MKNDSNEECIPFSVAEKLIEARNSYVQTIEKIVQEHPEITERLKKEQF